MKLLTCSISSIERYSNDTRRVVLTLPEPVDFHAGQYLQLLLPDAKFPFSIASPPEEQETLELHIRPTPDSEDSEAIEALLDTADHVDIEIPLGDCFISETPDHPLILIAASTGITQMKSIIEHLTATGLVKPVYLYWGVLTDADLYLAGLCQSWMQDHDNFHFIPVISEPENAPGWNGRTGLVGEAVLADFTDLSEASVIVSGSPGMVYATLDAFVAHGMPAENMKSDIFSYAPRN